MASSHRSAARFAGNALARAGLLAAVLTLSACASLKSVFAPQALSENLCRTPGTVIEYDWEGGYAPAPALMDGNPDTVAETSREIMIRLPERRPLRRVIIRNANYSDIFLYVHGGSGDGDWKMLGKLQQNRATTVEFDVSGISDRIRLRIGDTLDDTIGEKRVELDERGQDSGRRTTFHPGTPRAGEIEVYGYTTKSKADDVF